MLHITITKETETGTKTICDCDTENAICVVRDETEGKTVSLAELGGIGAFSTLVGFFGIHERLKNEKAYKAAKRIARKLVTKEALHKWIEEQQGEKPVKP